jgi:hypothetical protein
MRSSASTGERAHIMSCNCPESSDDVTDSAAYRWFRVLKVALGALVSLLTALKLLGLL